MISPGLRPFDQPGFKFSVKIFVLHTRQKTLQGWFLGFDRTKLQFSFIVQLSFSCPCCIYFGYPVQLFSANAEDTNGVRAEPSRNFVIRPVGV